MAIFHLAAQIIGRAVGRSATAAAAYRLGAVIEDERTGQRFDYTRKRGVDGWQIFGPGSMPAHLRDPSRLWNTVEKIEKRHDAQLCREIDIALPCELSPEQNAALVADWCQHFTDAGMIACVAFHHLHSHNPHAHIMLTLRELAGDGFGNKVRAWNDRKVLAWWRETWATKVNQHLAAAGVAVRVDHRTLAAQGIERAPTQHQGPIAHAMERRGVVPDRLREVEPSPVPMIHVAAEVPEEVTQAREAVATAEAEAIKRQKAEQRSAAERAERQRWADEDAQAARLAQQRANALRQQGGAHAEKIERWKQAHRWRVWWQRRGFPAAIPAIVREMEAARIKATKEAGNAQRRAADAATLAHATRSALIQADNANQHNRHRLAEARQQIASETERLQQAEARWRDAIAPEHAQRKAEWQRQEVVAEVIPEPFTTRRCGRRL